MPSWIASVTPTIAWLPGDAPPTSVAWMTPDDVPDEPLAGEDGAHLEEVGQVARAEVRVVHRDHVAGLERVRRVVVEHVPHGVRHRAEMRGARLACASSSPRASNTPVVKSPPSRT